MPISVPNEVHRLPRPEDGNVRAAARLPLPTANAAQDALDASRPPIWDGSILPVFVYGETGGRNSAVPRIPAAGVAHHLCDQRDRVAKLTTAQDHQEPRASP